MSVWGHQRGLWISINPIHPKGWKTSLGL